MAGPGTSDEACLGSARLATKTKLPPIVRTHDMFNLMLLGLLNIINIMYLLGSLDGHLLLYSSAAYFLVDAAYVAIWPRCVKSPVVILGHHVVSMVLIIIPLHYTRYIFCLSYCMLVELNTWLLIAKRTTSMAASVIEALFYASWILLRNIWYPWLILVFFNEWRKESQIAGPWNPLLATPIFQACLTGLNIHWTRELFAKRGKGKQMKQL